MSVMVRIKGQGLEGKDYIVGVRKPTIASGATLNIRYPYEVIHALGFKGKG
jgi:hypothetical protein